VDVAKIKDRQRHVWGLGDYAPLSKLLEPAAIPLCEACGVGEGQDVLDVAAGDGNFALAAARAGARVVASDISPGMVERGRKRFEGEGLDAKWVEADAEELPFGDDRFHCVGSAFGAMLAPRPEVVARELFRVTRPGGAVGMTAWTPESFAAELFEIGRRYLPPPPDMPLSHEWGDEAVVRERFGELAESIGFERRTVAWEAESPEALADRLEASAPVQVAAREALSAEEYEAMRRENLDLLRRWNSADGSLTIENEYLVTVARKPG
jgi:ubiquinone/menaquinone biosynthesis C-methylase UbiE